MITLEENPVLNGKEKELLRAITGAVRKVLPDAEIMLYGSRARGRPTHEHSDWDILVLSDILNSEIEEEIYAAVFDIELKENIIITPLVMVKSDWNGEKYRGHPLRERVETEGVLLK